MKRYRLNFCGTVLLCLAASLPARADIINFDSQAVGAPNSFTGALNSPLVINGVTFTGGQLLIDEIGGSNSPDQTGVYATANFLTGYSDPLPITFSTPVSGFSILVTNVSPDTFTVSDNLGGTSSFAIGAGGQHTFTLSDSGITSVDVSSANTGSWDFAIDNVTYTPLATTVPEPASILLLVTILGATVFLRRRKVGWNRQ